MKTAALVDALLVSDREPVSTTYKQDIACLREATRRYVRFMREGNHQKASDCMELVHELSDGLCNEAWANMTDEEKEAIEREIKERDRDREESLASDRQPEAADVLEDEAELRSAGGKVIDFETARRRREKATALLASV